MYNEIDGDFDDVTISTFKSGLPTEHGLRKSLTEKPVTSLRQLKDRIDKYRRVKGNQRLGKEKLRLSLRREEISGRTGTTITIDLKEILLGSPSLLMLRRLM